MEITSFSFASVTRFPLPVLDAEAVDAVELEPELAAWDEPAEEDELELLQAARDRAMAPAVRTVRNFFIIFLRKFYGYYRFSENLFQIFENIFHEISQTLHVNGFNKS